MFLISLYIADRLPIFIVKEKIKEKLNGVIVERKNYKDYNKVGFTDLVEDDWKWIWTNI